MKADQILRAGLDILVERGVQRDQPGGERTIPAVIAAFNALTGHAITEQQGWLFMALVKVKRSQTGKPDADHYVDGANYFALAGEAALAHERVPVCPKCKGAGHYIESGSDAYITCDCGAPDAFIGASMYGIPPASMPPLDPPANMGTIDATAYRWHELQALLRQRDEQLAGTGA